VRQFKQEVGKQVSFLTTKIKIDKDTILLINSICAKLGFLHEEVKSICDESIEENP
jgi:hypothetical protein